MLLELLHNPDAFFRRESNRLRLTHSAVVVTIAAMVSTLSSIVVMVELSAALPGGMRKIATIGGMIGVVVGFTSVFFIWLVCAAVFQVLSRLFDGEGEFRSTFILVGWGFIPSVFSGLVSAAAAYYAVTGVASPENAQAMQTFSQQLESRPTMKLANIVGAVFTVWSGFLWMFALRYARNLELREAGLTVGGPVLAMILWSFYQLL